MADQPDPQGTQIDSKITPEQWKVMFISGMGFFTDAYDLFIIGVVMAMIKPEWHPSPLAVGAITSTALFASAVGAILFGRIADLLGRKRIYGYEVLVLAIGAIASAFSVNMGMLILCRVILGLGIGGDYPVSATIMSEFSGKCSRGMLVSLVFSMQAAGLIVGPLLAAALLATGSSHEIVWRLLLAFGAVPALAVFHLRRKMNETPAFTKADEETKARRQKASFGEAYRKLGANRTLLLRLFGTSAAWFLMDFAYYGNTVSSPLVLSAITPHQTLMRHTLLQLMIFVCAAVPGYFVAAATMDKFGRKAIQTVGFAFMALAFGAIGVIPGIEKMVVPFLIIYGLSYFFTEFGPNATTFIYPSEIFPVWTRTTAHGIAAATGKVGAFIGVFLFPILMHKYALAGAELTAAGVSLLGIIVTLVCLPEPMGKSLEQLTTEAREAIAPISANLGARPSMPA
ncbi:MAG TPA: MFS transporter [Bryobacteraceae bacterium]|nr:MFS transporter [Bryobacteraceae bacterium]